MSVMGYRPEQPDSQKTCIHVQRKPDGGFIRLEYRIFENELGGGFSTLADAMKPKRGRPKKVTNDSDD